MPCICIVAFFSPYVPVGGRVALFSMDLGRCGLVGLMIEGGRPRGNSSRGRKLLLGVSLVKHPALSLDPLVLVFLSRPVDLDLLALLTT